MKHKGDDTSGPILTAMCFVVLLAILLAGGCSLSTSTEPPVLGSAAVDDATTPSADEAAELEPVDAFASRSRASPTGSVLPRLLDLGATRCIPCKMMAPILDELDEQYSDVFEVDFIDVWKNPEEAKRYSVETIPTQIFFDASGTERFRHEGFFAKEAILGKWQELGVNAAP